MEFWVGWLVGFDRGRKVLSPLISWFHFVFQEPKYFPLLFSFSFHHSIAKWHFSLLFISSPQMLYILTHSCPLFFFLIDFPGGSDGKASAYNAGDPGSIPGLGRSSGEGNGNPLQYFCLENLQYPCLENGQRSVVGYSPWGRKESDTTEWLHFLSFLPIYSHLSLN